MFRETTKLTVSAVGVVPVRVWVDDGEGGYSDCPFGHFAPEALDSLVVSLNAWGVQGEDANTHCGAASGEYVVWQGALEFHITVETDAPRQEAAHAD